MNKVPQDITHDLEHIQPIADETFQHDLEQNLMAQWYQQSSKTKRKRKKQGHMPLTFVASLLLVVLAGVIIMTLPLNSQVEYLAPQASPLPTPLPTLQPVPAFFPSDFSLILEPDMVAIALPINLETKDEIFKAGDVVDILATFNREQLDTSLEIVYFDVEDLLDTHQVDNLTVRIVVEHVKIMHVQTESSMITFQVSQQDAVVLTWLVESQIPITLSRIINSVQD